MWAKFYDNILLIHIICTPENLDDEVVRNMTCCGSLTPQKINTLLVLADFIKVLYRVFSGTHFLPLLSLLCSTSQSPWMTVQLSGILLSVLLPWFPSGQTSWFHYPSHAGLFCLLKHLYTYIFYDYLSPFFKIPKVLLQETVTH